MPFVDRLQPPLTTIRVNEYELGMRASQMLLALIEDPQARRETIMLAPELVVRGSAVVHSDPKFRGASAAPARGPTVAA